MQIQAIQNIRGHDQAPQEGNEDYSLQALESEEGSSNTERERV